MPEEGYVFDEGGARRIVDAVRRVEDSALPNMRGPSGHVERAYSNVQLLRVTGAKTTDTGVDYYPARLRLFDPATGWSDASVADALWLIHPTGAALTTDGTAVYASKQLRDSVTAGGVTRPLFWTTDRPVVVDVACVGGVVTGTKAG